MKQHRTLRRGLGILLALAMGLCLLAATALAEETQTADFTSGDGSTALALLNAAKTAGAADSTWDSTTKTLTLNGVDFFTEAATAVKLPAGSTIVLEAGTTNTITSTFESASDDSYSYGILVEDGDLTIEGGGQLAIKGGTAQYSDGIVVFSGSLTIDSGTVTATGGTASMGSYGVYTDNGVEISGGIVNATGGESGDGSHGIATNRDVTITGGTVIARGGNGGYSSYGIDTGYSYACTVTGGDVTAIGGNASNRSHGIYSRQYITISGGHVTAKTLCDASTEYRSALHHAPDLSGYPNYQWCTSASGDFTTTEYSYDPAHTYVEFSPGPITYTVHFDANGGSGSMTDATGVSSSYTLPKCNFTAPAGKQFKAWSVNGTEYAEGASIPVSANTTVTAVWEDIPAITGDQTADFTSDASAALALLNAAKTAGAADSTWNSATSTLTLKGVNFTTTADIAVKLPAGSTIVLAEDTTNTIKSTSPQTSMSDSYGILVKGGDLTIQGGGTLNVTGGGAAGSSYGISAQRGLTITGGTVGATGSGNAGSSTGIDSESIVKITGGTVNATGSDGTTNSHGIYAWGVEIKGGTVAAVSDGSSSIARSVGIWTQGFVTISGDDTVVTATGGAAQTDSHGIWTQTGEVTISGGSVTVTASSAEASSGICPGTHGDGKITISGGHVIATGKSALYVNETYGGALNLSDYPNYQWRTISDGEFTASTTTPYSYDAAHTYVEFKPAYAVSFNANGGSGSMAKVTGVSGSYTLPACTFTAPEGKQFKGWATSAAGKVISDASIPVTANTTLYAIWESIPVNGTADFTVDTDAALKLLNAAKTGAADSTWDSSTKTLTLSGVDFTTSAEIAVTLPANSTIVLAEGTKNTITSTSPSTGTEPSYGIYSEGNLTIGGSGTLTVTGGATGTSSRGIYACNNITITGGTVFANGGANASSSVGIFADGVAEIRGGKVTATGSTALRFSSGISAGNVVISGGTVAATGNTTNERSVGIFASNDVTISGADTVVTATGGKAGNDSHGIYAQFGDVTISGGTVTATGSTADDSFGINTLDGAITISGGHVTARTLATAAGAPATAARTLATTATNQSALNKAPDLSKYTGYRWRTASSGDYTASTDTPYAFDTAHTYVEFSGVDTANLADLPRTGDDSSLLLWIALLLASSLGVTGTVVYGKRNKYEK